MMDTATLITLLYLFITILFLVYPGIKRQPGIGILGALLLIGIALWQKETSLARLGFKAPGSWLGTAGLGLAIGSGLSLLSIGLVEPLVERITKQAHDVSLVENVRGSWKALASWLLIVWVVVALTEETLFRGFLMSELVQVLGKGSAGLALNLLITSLIFGISHWYQGPSGAWSTGIIGAVIGLVFIGCNFNLWLPILVHGFIDTVALILMSTGADKRLRRLVWGRETAQA
jgi:membrane protease YdiL (CAAX protease family)